MKLHDLEIDDLNILQDSLDDRISEVERLSENIKELIGDTDYNKLNFDLHFDTIKSALDVLLKQTYEEIRINEEAEEMSKDTLYDLQRDLL